MNWEKYTYNGFQQSSYKTFADIYEMFEERKEQRRKKGYITVLKKHTETNYDPVTYNAHKLITNPNFNILDLKTNQWYIYVSEFKSNDITFSIAH